LSIREERGTPVSSPLKSAGPTSRRERQRQARAQRSERWYRLVFVVTALVVLADLIAGGLRRLLP
jgi:hypothetical protein